MEIVSKKISYIYQAGTPLAQPALNDLSIRIPSGVFAAILGPTGSGKSTLIQLIAGLLTPTTGTVHVGDHLITPKTKKLSALRRQVGIVFQYPEYQLFGETVIKDIAFGPTNQGLEPQEIDQRVRRAMELVGIPDRYADQSPFLLSGGQMRKVAIAGVLAMEPAILILDEPTVGLDPKSRREFLQLISSIHQNRRMTILLITHQMDDAAAYAETIYLMNRGSCVAEGTREEILTDEALLTPLGLDIPEILKLVRQINQGLDDPIPDNVFSLSSLVTMLDDQWKKGDLP